MERQIKISEANAYLNSVTFTAHLLRCTEFNARKMKAFSMVIAEPPYLYKVMTYNTNDLPPLLPGVYRFERAKPSSGEGRRLIFTVPSARNVHHISDTDPSLDLSALKISGLDCFSKDPTEDYRTLRVLVIRVYTDKIIQSGKTIRRFECTGDQCRYDITEFVDTGKDAASKDIRKGDTVVLYGVKYGKGGLTLEGSVRIESRDNVIDNKIMDIVNSSHAPLGTFVDGRIAYNDEICDLPTLIRLKDIGQDKAYVEIQDVEVRDINGPFIRRCKVCSRDIDIDESCCDGGDDEDISYTRYRYMMISLKSRHDGGRTMIDVKMSENAMKKLGYEDLQEYKSRGKDELMTKVSTMNVCNIQISRSPKHDAGNSRRPTLYLSVTEIRDQN